MMISETQSYMMLLEVKKKKHWFCENLDGKQDIHHLLNYSFNKGVRVSTEE